MSIYTPNAYFLDSKDPEIAKIRLYRPATLKNKKKHPVTFIIRAGMNTFLFLRGKYI